MNSRIFSQSVQPINTTSLGKSFFVTASYFETGKLCSLHACHSSSTDSIEEKSVSESGHGVLSNV